jgi:hypothetical protein
VPVQPPNIDLDVPLPMNESDPLIEESNFIISSSRWAREQSKIDQCRYAASMTKENEAKLLHWKSKIAFEIRQIVEAARRLDQAEESSDNSNWWKE